MYPDFYGISALLELCGEESKARRETQLADKKKHTLQDFKALENFTTGRLGGLAELNSGCQ